MFDVIVVGARCAGAALAMLVARQGAKVLLLDRSTFPSDIPHGHFIHRHGPRRLRSWGLLEPVAMDAAMADYQSQRDAASAADYTQNIQEARFPPVPASALALRAAVRSNPEEATRMIKARNQMIDPASFFNRENIARLLGQSSATVQQ